MRNLRLFLLWTLIGSCALLPDLAFALRIPHPIATDRRIYAVNYSPNEVYKFLGHYRYQSSIEFSPEEEIKTISVGDSVAWSIVPSNNRIFIKPIENDATTNMTVITNKRTYHFEMYGEEAESITDGNMMFVLRFNYPEDHDTGINASSNYLDPVPDLDYEDPNQYNFRYSITGSNVIAPVRIFDDGEFTYFQFRNRNAEIPAFFVVDSRGNEGIINYRVRGDYIVVERVAARFTLRHGVDVVCVYNDGMPWRPAPPQ